MKMTPGSYKSRLFAALVAFARIIRFSLANCFFYRNVEFFEYQMVVLYVLGVVKSHRSGFHKEEKV